MLQFGSQSADHADMAPKTDQALQGRHNIGLRRDKWSASCRLLATAGALTILVSGSVGLAAPASAATRTRHVAWHPTTAPRKVVPAPAPPVSTPPAIPPVVAPVPQAPAAPILGLLAADGAHFAQERAAGVGAVTINVGWNNAEPVRGVFDANYLASVNGQIAAAVTAGLRVILEPGIQYPPDWVFNLPGGTRFVNQYGDVFRGASDSGNNVANTVTNPAVHAALGSYLAGLGARIDRSHLLAVRQGGGPYGELRYPEATYNGHTDSWWAYDTDSQASSPVRGWKPGTGTSAQAAQFLSVYNSNLNKLGVWLNSEFTTDFATTNLVMLPGWGERPGDQSNIVASRLTTSSDEWNQGLDWTGLLPSLPNRSTSVAYTTYLDAPSFSGNADPADFLATLAAANNIREGGENTGNGDITALTLSVQRAKSLHFFVLNWMDESQVVASSTGARATGPTFASLAQAASALS